MSPRPVVTANAPAIMRASSISGLCIRLQVLDRRPQSIRVVSEHSDSAIAIATQQPTRFRGRMVVIRTDSITAMLRPQEELASANRTGSLLGREHLGKPLLIPSGLAESSRGCNIQMLLALGICQWMKTALLQSPASAIYFGAGLRAESPVLMPCDKCPRTCRTRLLPDEARNSLRQ